MEDGYKFENHLIPDWDGADSVLGAELLGERGRHNASALVGWSIEVGLTALSGVTRDERIDLHYYLQKYVPSQAFIRA